VFISGSAPEGGTYVIRPPVRFDLATCQDFQWVMASAVTFDGCCEIVIDLCGTEYIDSSAIGMLLLLRERAQKGGKTVALARAKGAVKCALEITNLGRIFALR